jgi:hypothetical protein
MPRFRLKLKGFTEFVKAFDGRRARQRLEREQRKKMRAAVLLLRTEVIQYIDSEKHGVPNSPLTILIKGSSRPLVDHGDLRQGITTAVEVQRGKVHGAVGVLKKGRVRGAGGRFKRAPNVAAALHEGFDVKVTPEVRKAVFAEMRRRRGNKVRIPEGGGGAKTWHVRGRPFIREPLEENEERIIAELGEGVKLTLRGLGKR